MEYLTTQSFSSGEIKALGVSEGFSVFKPQSKLRLLETCIPSLIKRVFLGEPVPRSSTQLYLPLNSRRLTIAKDLGLKVPKPYWTGGLLTSTSLTKGELLTLKQRITFPVPTSQELLIIEELRQLYQQIADQIENTESLLEISATIDSYEHLLKELGTLVLPTGAFDKAKSPVAVIENIAPWIGKAFLLNTAPDEPVMPTNRNDIPYVTSLDTEVAALFLARTPPDELFYTQDPTPGKVKYPSIKATRRFNRHHAIASKARLAQDIYRKITVVLPHIKKRQYHKYLAYIKSLRPPMATLKAFYMSRGDTQELVDLLVTPENYPYLPNVWITKRQQTALLDTLAGRGHEHQAFINAGFMG